MWFTVREELPCKRLGALLFFAHRIAAIGEAEIATGPWAPIDSNVVASASRNSASPELVSRTTGLAPGEAETSSSGLGSDGVRLFFLFK